MCPRNYSNKKNIYNYYIQGGLSLLLGRRIEWSSGLKYGRNVITLSDKKMPGEIFGGHNCLSPTITFVNFAKKNFGFFSQKKIFSLFFFPAFVLSNKT